jgi:hypothetical protein
MKFFPFDKLAIESKLSDTEITSRLAKYVVNYKRNETVDDPIILYNGIVRKNNFTMMRIEKRMDSFRPFIKGKIENTGNGSKIIVRMSLHPIIILLLLALFSVISYQIIRYARIQGVIFIIFTYLMTIYFFNQGVNKVKKDFSMIFQTQPKINI